jgi:hypothetical protein
VSASQLPAPYPLAWPPGRVRTPPDRREKGRYSLRLFSQAMATIEAEIARWQRPRRDARLVDWQLSSWHVGRSQLHADPGAALWFTLAGKDITGGASLMVLACDRFQELPQNVRALSLTMERLRLVDEVGAYTLVAAVEGAKALPPPADARGWHEILGVAESAPLVVAEAAYRALARAAGEGSPRLRDLNDAIARARAAVKEGATS